MVQINFETKRQIRLMTPAVVIFILLIVVSVGAYYAWEFYQKKLIAKMEVLNKIEEIRKMTHILQMNKQILEPNIDHHNQNLDQLIPNEDDYFSVVNSIETLASNTGFNIKDYNISLDSDKIGVSISGQGSQDDFLRFLKEHKFAGGRYASVKKVSFDQVTGETKFEIVFYNRSANQKTTEGSHTESESLTNNSNVFLTDTFASESNTTQITTQDLKILEAIEQQLPRNKPDSNTNYKAINNPF